MCVLDCGSDQFTRIGVIGVKMFFPKGFRKDTPFVQWILMILEYSSSHDVIEDKLLRESFVVIGSSSCDRCPPACNRLIQSGRGLPQNFNRLRRWINRVAFVGTCHFNSPQNNLVAKFILTRRDVMSTV